MGRDWDSNGDTYKGLNAPLGRGHRGQVVTAKGRPRCRGITSGDTMYQARRANQPCVAFPLYFKPCYHKVGTWQASRPLPYRKACCQEKHPINANFHLIVCLWIRRMWLFCSLGVCSFKRLGDGIIQPCCPLQGCPSVCSQTPLTLGVRKMLWGKELLALLFFPKHCAACMGLTAVWNSLLSGISSRAEAEKLTNGSTWVAGAPEKAMAKCCHTWVLLLNELISNVLT